MRKIVSFSLLLLGTLILTSCNGNTLGTIPVTGQVKVDGQPVAGVSVMFYPTDTANREVGGRTDASGRFSLTVAGAEVGSGAIPGEYIPTFTWEESVAEGMSEAEIQRKYPNSPPPNVNRLPEKYGNRNATDVAPVEIKRGAKNVFNFELTSE